MVDDTGFVPGILGERIRQGPWTAAHSARYNARTMFRGFESVRTMHWHRSIVHKSGRYWIRTSDLTDVNGAL